MFAFWIFGYLLTLTTQIFKGISLKGTFQIQKNMFFTQSFKGTYDGNGLIHFFNTLIIFILFLLFLYCLVCFMFQGNIQHLFKRLTNIIFTIICLELLAYYAINQMFSKEMIQAVLQGVLLPEMICICIYQLTNVRIAQIKKEIVKQSQLFDFTLDILPKEYKGLSKEWRKYFFVETIERNEKYYLGHPFDKTTNKLRRSPDIVDTYSQTIVFMRLKYTFFTIDFVSNPPIPNIVETSCRAKGVEED